MPARHPASAPSHLPLHGERRHAWSGEREGLSAHSHAAWIAVGFLTGEGALLFPFAVFWPFETPDPWALFVVASPQGMVAFLLAGHLMVLAIAIGVPAVAIWRQDRRRWHIAVGVLTSAVVAFWLLCVGLVALAVDTAINWTVLYGGSGLVAGVGLIGFRWL